MSRVISRPTPALTAVVWVGALVAGCWAGVGYAQQQTASVSRSAMTAGEIGIDNFTFAPVRVTVTTGTTVTWVNHDEEPHTVVNRGATRLFRSAALDTDDKFSFKFDQPGTYDYFCSVHPNMHGTIVVQ